MGIWHGDATFTHILIFTQIQRASAMLHALCGGLFGWGYVGEAGVGGEALGGEVGGEGCA